MNTFPTSSAARVSGCDVLVIGGGPAGSTAVALKKFDRTMRIRPKLFSWFVYRITTPSQLFKGLYYAASLLNFRCILKVWRMRKHSILIVDETGTAVN